MLDLETVTKKQGNLKGGICCGGYLAITYGGDRVIVPLDFFVAKPAK